MTATVRREDVERACEELLAEGKSISANAVLKKTRGSKSTVLRHLAELRPQFAARASQPDDPDVAHLNRMVAPVMLQIWSAAKERADAERLRQGSMLITLQQGLQEDLEDLRAENEELDQKLADAEAKSGDLERLVAKLEEWFAPPPELRGGRPRPGSSETSAVQELLKQMATRRQP